jgi:hypothetical protein
VAYGVRLTALEVNDRTRELTQQARGDVASGRPYFVACPLSFGDLSPRGGHKCTMSEELITKAEWE